MTAGLLLALGLIATFPSRSLMRPWASVGFGRLNPSPPAPLPLVNSESDGMAGTFADAGYP